MACVRSRLGSIPPVPAVEVARVLPRYPRVESRPAPRMHHAAGNVAPGFATPRLPAACGHTGNRRVATVPTPGSASNSRVDHAHRGFGRSIVEEVDTWSVSVVIQSPTCPIPFPLARHSCRVIVLVCLLAAFMPRAYLVRLEVNHEIHFLTTGQTVAIDPAYRLIRRWLLNHGCL